jgi:hypothetical protein
VGLVASQQYIREGIQPDSRDCPPCCAGKLSSNPCFIIGVEAVAPASAWSGCWLRFLLRQKKIIRNPTIMAAPNPPPTAPPMTAPLLEPLFGALEGLGIDDGAYAFN